jgi:alpha-mannosidase
MTWGVDLWAPTDKVIDNISLLNRDSASAARFIVGTPTDFFGQAARTAGVPETSGEIPSAWPNVATSLLHMWQLAVPATNALLDAEKFSAINYALGYADYPQREMEFLWKKLIESMDHNHDGQGGSIGDDRKIGYSQMAILRGNEIMRDMTRNIAERVEVPIPGSFPIVVFNSQGWPRSDVVKAHVTLYGDVSPGDLAEFRKGLRLTDEKGTPVPLQVEEYSENISRALNVVFVAKDVPPVGYKTFYLAAAAQPDSFPRASEVSLDSERDFVEPRRPLGVDTMENAFYRVSVDKATGRVTLFDKALKRDVCKDMEVAAVEERGGNNVAAEELTGRVIPTSINRVELEENNAVRTVMKIIGQVADVPVVQRLLLYQGLKRLDVENRIEWKGPRFVRLQQLFPIPREARVRYGTAFAAQAADNIIPGSEPHQKDELQKDAWLKYRQIQDWVSADAAGACLTVAVDHQLIRLDEGLIRGEMIRGLRFTSVKVVRGAEVSSLQYPPPGSYLFKYSLSSAPGDWRSALAYEAGIDFNSPLIPVSVVDGISSKSLPPTNSFCSVRGDGIVVSALKKSDVDSSLVLRVYEIKGSSSETGIEVIGKPRAFREANLLEEEVGQRDERVLRLNPYQIKTLKIRVE